MLQVVWKFLADARLATLDCHEMTFDTGSCFKLEERIRIYDENDRDHKKASGLDTIEGFVSAHDTLQFSLDDVNAAIYGLDRSAGTVNAANAVISSVGVALDAYDYFVYDTDDGDLYFEYNGSGAVNAVQLATPVGHLKSMRATSCWLPKCRLKDVVEFRICSECNHMNCPAVKSAGQFCSRIKAA